MSAAAHLFVCLFVVCPALEHVHFELDERWSTGPVVDAAVRERRQSAIARLSQVTRCRCCAHGERHRYAEGQQR